MFTQNVISALQTDLLTDMFMFVPELLLCTGIVVMLLLRLLPRLRLHAGWVALFFSGFALLLVIGHWFEISFKLGGSDVSLDFLGKVDARRPVFTGLLVIDHFTAVLRLILLAFAVLITWLSMITGIPDEEDSADFFTLLLGGIVGMMLMAASNHLLMVFIAVEMASLPSYALAGFLKGRRQSSEAALKYVVYGGGASGVMLYGISLLSGRFSTGYLPDVVVGVQAQLLKGGAGAASVTGLDTVVVLGIVFVLVGLAFKLSAVPFHFWCPDVFEGAAAEIGAYLSVASKAAAMALTGRLLLTLAGSAELELNTFLAAATGKVANLPRPEDVTLAVQKAFAPAVAFFAALTATFGNLAAYPQTNLKRLLAYSTIAHAGYMLMGLAPMNPDGAKAVVFYLIAYLVMNLGAFAVIALLRNQTGSEDIRDFRGLVYRSPLMVVLLGVFLLSLLGLPPLVGFAAKFQVFSVLFEAGKQHASAGNTSLGYTFYGLLLIGGINTVISTVYYLKVLKVMVLEKPIEELENKPAKPLGVPVGGLVFASLLGLLILLGGVAWNPLAVASEKASIDFRPATRTISPAAPPPAGGGFGRPGGAPGGGAPPGARAGGGAPPGARPGGAGPAPGGRP